MERRIRRACAQILEETTMATEHDERVRERAYHLWRESGGEHGKEMEHWLQAEQEESGKGSRASAKAPVKASVKKAAEPAKAKAAPTSAKAAAPKTAGKAAAPAKAAPAPKAVAAKPADKPSPKAAVKSAKPRAPGRSA
jgi:hypothetical protein